MKFRLHVPELPPPRNGYPLLVALHGCLQSAADFASGTRFDQVADAQNAIVMYPEQDMRQNPRRCWNWFNGENQARGGPEPTSILDWIAQVSDRYRIDRSRIAVAGISAGGSMAAILAEQAPDIISAVGVVAGMPLHAGTEAQQAWKQMKSGEDLPTPPEILRRLVEQPRAYERMRVQIWAGEQDRMVNPRNAHVLAEQFRTLLRLDPDPVASIEQPMVIVRWRDAAGAVRVELRVVQGLGHQWSGGSLQGSHTTQRGPDMSAIMLPFLLSAPVEVAQTQAPEVSSLRRVIKADRVS